LDLLSLYVNGMPLEGPKLINKICLCLCWCKPRLSGIIKNEYFSNKQKRLDIYIFELFSLSHNINMDCKWDTRLSIFNQASLNNCTKYFINILIYLHLRVSNTSDKFLRVRSFKWMLYTCLLCKDSHRHWLCIENGRRQWLCIKHSPLLAVYEKKIVTVIDCVLKQSPSMVLYKTVTIICCEIDDLTLTSTLSVMLFQTVSVVCYA
jgi:hypothetical protein